MSQPQLPREAGALEAIVHLQKKICLMWGSAELDVFIGRLIMDSRDGQRQGLPVSVGDELMFLAEVNKIVRAIDMVRAQKVPFRDALRAVEEGDQKRYEADTFDNPLISRDTVVRARNAERREAARPQGQTARSSPSVLAIIFRLFALLVAGALAIQYLWPYLTQATR